MTTTLSPEDTIYNKEPQGYDYNSVSDIIESMKGRINNRLFATFTLKEDLDGLVENIQSTYTILFNKVFVLEVVDSDEYVVTYNVDGGNLDSIPENTILLHRKKESALKG